MISRWIEDIALKDVSLSDADKVILKYGMSKLFYLLKDTLFTFILGWLLKIPIESMIFQLGFVLLRTYAGGCHSKTELECKVHSGFVTVLSLACIRWLPDEKALIGIGEIIFSGIIVFLAPVEAKNKPLSKTERRINRRNAIICVAAVNAIMFAGIIRNWRVLYAPLAVVIWGVGILMLAGEVSNQADKMKTKV